MPGRQRITAGLQEDLDQRELEDFGCRLNRIAEDAQWIVARDLLVRVVANIDLVNAVAIAGGALRAWHVRETFAHA